MYFNSERLTFKEFQEQDFPLFYSVFSNEQIMKYALNDRYCSEDESVAYFSEILMNNSALENRRAYEFAVYLSSDNTFIGFADIEKHYQGSIPVNGEIGYFLLPEFWGYGYATEIARKLIDICFSFINLHKVVARCNANNFHSERVMKKAGMTKEGEFRKARFKNGQWDNELHYGILIEEWR
jgi:ribosomal-protein-alanine N-acetyltransferase